MAFANAEPTRPLPAIKREKRELRRIFDHLTVRGAFRDSVVVTAATAQDIVDEFQLESVRGTVRVFHFGGHASRSEVMLMKISGGPSQVPASVFADYLASQPGLALVFLNACHTRPQVERLRIQGIAAVISTSTSIEDEAAADFARNFYTQLVAGRSLREAFDDARATVKFLCSSEGRELVHEGTPDDEAEEPWFLDCEDDQWALVPPPDPPDDGDGTGLIMVTIDGRVVLNEMARVLYREGEAILILRRAGFPRADIPSFTNAREFWFEVAEQADSGRIAGGFRQIVVVAAELYPHNEILARYLESTQSIDDEFVSPPKSFDPESFPEIDVNGKVSRGSFSKIEAKTSTFSESPKPMLIQGGEGED